MKRLALLLVVACGTKPPEYLPDAGMCVAYVVPAGTDLTMPIKSFKADVMNIFNNNGCSSSDCHGSDSPTGGLFLGAMANGGSDFASVYTGLVNVPSASSMMPFVTPGSPITSFLMHKVDGDQCQFDATCVTANGNDCLFTMPKDGAPLSIDERDTIRRWISQGAQNN